MNISKETLKQIIKEELKEAEREFSDIWDQEAAEIADDFDEKTAAGAGDDVEQEKLAFLRDVSKRWYDEFDITEGDDLFGDYEGSDVERKQMIIDKLLSNVYDELKKQQAAPASSAPPAHASIPGAKGELNESLVDIVSDPATMAALAGALGVGVLALKGLLQGQSKGGSDIALQNTRDAINKRVALSQMQLPPTPPEDLGTELDVSPKKRAERELRRLKALRARQAQDDAVHMELSEAELKELKKRGY
jgi:hypothetical protein